MMKRVRNVTVADFSREVLFSRVPVVVAVHSDRSGACRALAPLLETDAKWYAGELAFAKADADASPEVAELYRIDVVPALLLFRHGEPIDHLTGIPPTSVALATFDDLAGRVGARRLIASRPCCG